MTPELFGTLLADMHPKEEKVHGSPPRTVHSVFHVRPAGDGDAVKTPLSPAAVPFGEVLTSLREGYVFAVVRRESGSVVAVWGGYDARGQPRGGHAAVCDSLDDLLAAKLLNAHERTILHYGVTQ